MAADGVSTIFGMLRDCEPKQGEEFEQCLAEAILETEQEQHKTRFSFMKNWNRLIESPCNKIVGLVSKNKALLGSEEGQDSFPENLLEDYKVCGRLSVGLFDCGNVMDIVFEEYKNRGSDD